MAQRTGQGPDRFRDKREGDWDQPTEMVFRCEVCGLEGYPESKMRWQSGKRVCIDDYEEDGGPVERELIRQRLIGRGADKEARKRIPKFPYNWQTTVGITGFSARPLEITAGSPAASYFEVYGVKINSSTITLTTSGPSIPGGVTYYPDELKMSMFVSGQPVSKGYYNLIINGKTYKNVFHAV